MGAPTGIDVEALKAEVEQLRKDKAELESTVKSLNERVWLHYVLFLFFLMSVQQADA